MTEVRRHIRIVNGREVNVRRHHRDSGVEAVDYHREGEPETWMPPDDTGEAVWFGEDAGATWAGYEDQDPDEEDVSPAFRALGLDSPQFRRLKTLRDSGYTGPVDQDGYAVPDGPPPATLRVAPADGQDVSWAAPDTSASALLDELRLASMDGQLRTAVQRMPDGTLRPFAQFRNGKPVEEYQ